MKTSGAPPLSSLGRYEILATIGSGGMAAIYLARIAGPAGFEKPVALKVIHTHLAEDPEFVAMFLDEARIAAQLYHPNIVQIIELGEAEGIYYIAMEYLRGETVGAIVQRVVAGGQGLMDARMACHIILAACEGLHHAHETSDNEGRPLGLVHRDVSPQNLFVTYSGGVKIMDFGIARAAGIAHSTRPGSLKGKFSYMSPEQAQGRPIDRRSDVFALGIVLWEMLSGRRLFKGQTDIESLRRVSEARVPLVAELRRGIPPVLDSVVQKALARRVEERYQSALELHADLSLVADQLGSSVATHELAQRMGVWFPNEEIRKKALLAKTVPVMHLPTFLVGEPAGGQARVEDTPSVSESSGVRLRDNEGEDLSAPETPSGAHPWQPPSEQGSVQPIAPRPIVEQHLDEVPARRPGLLIASVVAGLILVGGIIGIVAFFVPRMLTTPPRHPDPVLARPSAPAAPQAVPADLSSAAVGQGPATPAPVPGAAPPSAGDASSAPSTVSLRLDVTPRTATVTVDGQAQADPSAVTLPRSTTAVEVVVSAPGYLDEAFSLVPEGDVQRTVSLSPRRRRPPGKAPPGRPAGGGDLVSNPYGR